MRLDQYVAQFWPEYSRSVWQKYIALGYVQVNGKVVASTKISLDEDDKVTVNVPEKTDYTSDTLPIIYEDDNVIVINKPVGVLTHSKGELNDEFTVAEFFRGHTTFNLDTNRPGIIHRLDRATSGILIGAKNPDAARHLSKQFQDRKAKKTYYAVLTGIPKEPKAILDLPIGRNPAKPSSFRVDSNGKSAETFYEVETTNDRHEAFVRLEPKTGRTHQLRVHMAYLNTPIKGDPVYGKVAERMYLHAAKLEITVPGGERKTFEASLPDGFYQGMSK